MKLTNYGQFNRDLQRHGIEYAAEHTVMLGFDSVEFLGLSNLAKDTKSAARLLSSLGLGVACFSEGIDLLDTKDKTRAQLEEYLFRCADAAAELGSPYLHHTLVFPLTLPPCAPVLNDILPVIASSAERVARYCENLGLVCIYEPQGMYFNGTGLEVFFAEMKKRCRNIGICGDVGNSLFVDHSPSLIFDKLAKHIKHVHLKDYKVLSEPLPNKNGYKTRGGRWLYNVELGAGDADIDYCLSKLYEQGYDGAFSFEINGSDDMIKNAINFVKSRTGWG